MDVNIKVIGIEAFYFTFLRTSQDITTKKLAKLARQLDIVFIVEFALQYDFLSYYNKNMPVYMAETYDLVKNSDIVIAPLFKYLDSTILLFVSIKGDKDSKVIELKYDMNINKIVNSK